MFREPGRASSPGRAVPTMSSRITPMELGRCPRCSTSYSASEVSGFGVLRGRSAQRGGPRVEYSCQDCGRQILLIPHGEGRYAPPGQPPPDAVPIDARTPPWLKPESDRERPAAPPQAEPRPPPRPAEAPPPPPVEPPPALEVSPAEALALLGVGPGADRQAIERAFRERSLACHPDKVAHLDPDFIELAERKFRRLQQAYELLTD